VGRAIHRRVCDLAPRRPESVHTFFMRNPPLLEQLSEVVEQWPADRPVRIASVGCSSGAELYTVLWLIRSRRPDLRVQGVGIDIDPAVLEKAAAGVYGRDDLELSLLPAEHFGQIFVNSGSSLAVASWIAEGTEWRQCDVVRDDLEAAVGRFDMVLANNLLCHLPARAAEVAMRNIVRLVGPAGCLVCYGVDLDLRERVVQEAGFSPFPCDIARSYAAEPRALWKWPFAYWAQEPFDGNRTDAMLRYSSIFVTLVGAL
jgi:SAM-dependent methyltransferase